MIEELYHRTPDATIKTRCQIMLLEAKPMSVPQIAQVIFYSEDTVARCISGSICDAQSLTLPFSRPVIDCLMRSLDARRSMAAWPQTVRSVAG